jgi:hypothetical protein
MRLERIFAISLALLTTACAHASPPTVEQALHDHQDALVQLRNRGCDAGTCPVYGVSLFADGNVFYVGGAHVQAVGERRLKVPNATVVAVIDALDRLDFLDLPEHCCDCGDAPSSARAATVVIDYRPGGLEKEIVVDDRCAAQSNSATVLELFRRIERMVGVEPMISKRARTALERLDDVPSADAWSAAQRLPVAE